MKSYKVTHKSHPPLSPIATIKLSIAYRFGYMWQQYALGSRKIGNGTCHFQYAAISTGCTLRDYLVNVRLGNVSRMMLDTDESIANISFYCGFNNLSNFNRLFKDRKGCSPSSFREDMRNKDGNYKMI